MICAWVQGKPDAPTGQPISEGQLFQQRRTTSLFQAALTTIALIYHMTVYKLRKGERSAIVMSTNPCRASA